MVQSVHVYVPVKADLNCLLFFIIIAQPRQNVNQEIICMYSAC